jgi:hypothetical protein
MFDTGSPIPWLSGIVVLVLILLAFRGVFSPETRERRRRDRSHGPVISRKRGPTVKLAANVDKSKGDRKR